MLLSIEKTIAELGNCDKPLFGSRLIELSNLNSEEMGMVFIFSVAPLVIGQAIRWARHFLKPGSEA